MLSGAALAEAADTAPRPAPGLLAAVEAAPVAPALRLDTLDGPPAGLTGDETAAIIHFFATWCEPCRSELPALGRFAVRRPDVRVLLVDVAEPEDRIRRFFAGHAAPGAILLDRDRAAARRWGVSLMPATFVVAEGRLRLAHEGEVDWDAAATHAVVSAIPGADRSTTSQGGQTQ